MVSKLIDYSSKKGFDGIQLTIPPGFYSNRVSNYIEYSLLINGFDYYRRDVTSILTIESSEDKILNKFKPSHQRALRKSKKSGVTTKLTNRVDEFFSMLKNLLQHKLFANFPDETNLWPQRQ